ARTLAYLASLLLQTLPSVKNEVSIAHGYEEWRELLRQTVPDASGDPPHPSEPDPDGGAPSSGVEGGSESAGFCENDSNRASADPSAASDPEHDELPDDELVDVSG